jgi:hypothetical protein
MWKHGIHAFLEVLRHRRPESQEYMLAFIYLAYQMMSLLLETVPNFTDTWIECLGDLARYRMAIEEDCEIHTIWGGVAGRWYAMAADRHPVVGRLYHHSGIFGLALEGRDIALERFGRQAYGTKSPERSSPFTHRSTAALVYEPEISGFMHDTAVTFFPDNQSAYDIMSYDYAKRNHFEINSSTKGKLRTARGAMVNTLGTVSRPIHFAKESETYMREFHVLPKCVHDIILGSPFLRLTQTFTKFRHRVVNKLRGLSSRHRVCFTGSSQQMLAGWANGQSVLALPDTGSDICLMSAQYARERGYRVDTDPRHRQLLEFVDGSTAETLGRVEGFQWEFDKSDIQLHTPEIHVLEDLQTDLLLGYDFLMETDAFSTHEELFVDIEPHDEHVDEMFGWLACAIKLVTFSNIRGHGWKALAKLGLKSRSHAASKFLNMRLVQDSDMFADCATTDRVRQSAGMARQRTPRNDFVRRKTCSGARLV